jgi:hypothetical protein
MQAAAARLSVDMEFDSERLVHRTRYTPLRFAMLVLMWLFHINGTGYSFLEQRPPPWNGACALVHMCVYSLLWDCVTYVGDDVLRVVLMPLAESSTTHLVTVEVLRWKMPVCVRVIPPSVAAPVGVCGGPVHRLKASLPSHVRQRWVQCATSTSTNTRPLGKAG